MSKILTLALCALGSAFLGLSFYSTWALREMSFDQIGYYQDFAIKAISDPSTPLNTPPNPWWLGDGYIGLAAPTVLAILGVVMIVAVWHRLSTDKDY